MHEMKNGTLCMVILAAVAVFASPPEAPKPDEWTFRQELSKPVAYHALEAYRLADEFCLTGNLETVRTDLERFLASAGRPAEKTLTLRRGKVAGRESYRCEICAGGNVVLTAEDADGIRRAAITPQHEVKEYTVGPSASGWSFRLVLDCRGWGDNPARRPAWLCLVGDSAPLWPGIAPSSVSRLNIGNMSPDVYGRIW